jgi:hypothetical protein
MQDAGFVGPGAKALDVPASREGHKKHDAGTVAFRRHGEASLASLNSVPDGTVVKLHVSILRRASETVAEDGFKHTHLPIRHLIFYEGPEKYGSRLSGYEAREVINRVPAASLSEIEDFQQGKLQAALEETRSVCGEESALSSPSVRVFAPSIRKPQIWT